MFMLADHVRSYVITHFLLDACLKELAAWAHVFVLMRQSWFPYGRISSSESSNTDGDHKVFFFDV